MHILRQENVIHAVCYITHDHQPNEKVIATSKGSHSIVLHIYDLTKNISTQKIDIKQKISSEVCFPFVFLPKSICQAHNLLLMRDESKLWLLDPET